jgi:hypothetical protein
MRTITNSHTMLFAFSVGHLLNVVALISLLTCGVVRSAALRNPFSFIH